MTARRGGSSTVKPMPQACGRASGGRGLELVTKQGLKPGLAVVLVGEDPASKVYVANKAKQTVEAGMNWWDTGFPPRHPRRSFWRSSIS